MQKNIIKRDVILLMYNIVIIGAGGFGREVYLWAKDAFSNNQYKIKGFLDDNNKALDDYNLEIGIIGNIDSYTPKEQDRFLVAIGSINAKKNIITKLKNKSAKFLKLIHPSAIIAKTSMIGEGVIICPYVLVSDSVKLGNFVLMNSYSMCGHDVKVGDYCILSPYANVNGFSILENEVFLSIHATVIPYIRIGYRSKVSANSVVMRNVLPNKMVFGVPGRAIEIIKKK